MSKPRVGSVPPPAFVVFVLALAMGLLGGCGESSDPPTTTPEPPPTAGNSAEPQTEAAEAPSGTRDSTEIGLPTVTLDETQANVEAGAGGSLELDDGFTLQIPPGALEKDAAVSVRKLRIKPSDTGLLEALVCYEIVAGDERRSTLRGEVTVTIPVPKSAEKDDVRLVHYRGDGSVEILAHELAAPGRIQASLQSFSWLHVAAVSATALWKVSSDAAEQLAVADAVLEDTSDKRVLPVPFYHQSDYAWCWATSASMVFGAQGATIQPQEVAALFDAERSQGGSFWPRVFGNSFDFRTIAADAGLPSLPMRMHAFGGLWEKSLRGWLIQQIRAGRPVWVGLRKYDAKGGDHAIVVVGYDHVGFYLHDPSGALLAQLEVNRGNAKKKVDAQVDERRLANVRVPFGEWKHLMAPGLFQYRPWLTNIGVVDAPVDDDARTVSLQIGPGTVGGGGLRFHRDGFTFSTLSESLFYWNGQRPRGCGFSRIYTDFDQADEAKKLGAAFLSNSDALNVMKVLLHNTGAAGFEGSVRVMLDGEPISASTEVAARAPSGTTNYEVTVASNARVAAFRDPAQSAYVPVSARAAQPLTEALNFMSNPLALGKHTLTVELRDRADERVDRVSVPFEMHPAVPSNVSVENVKQPIAGSETVVHRVTWDPSPEEARLRAIGRKGRYLVYRVDQRDADLDDPELVATIAARNLARYEAGAPAPEGKRVRYAVAFEDEGTGYASPLCQPSRAATDDPPAEAPAFTWHWHARLWKPGQISVQLQKKPGIGGMEPYLLVVEAEGDRQYLYPHNATGYSGQRLDQTYALRPGRVPKTLKVTAYLADGTIKKGAVDIDWGRGKPPKASSAQDIESRLTKAKTEFERALGSRFWRSAPNLARAHQGMQAWYVPNETADVAFASATSRVEALFAELKPEDQSRLEPDRDEILARLKLHHMSHRHARGDVDGYLAMLEERRATGTAHPRELVRAAEAVIRYRNDTERAHALWKQFQQYVPTWEAALSAEELKSSKSLQRDVLTYAKLAEKDLAYPVPPIRAE